MTNENRQDFCDTWNESCKSEQRGLRRINQDPNLEVYTSCSADDLPELYIKKSANQILPQSLKGISIRNIVLNDDREFIVLTALNKSTSLIFINLCFDFIFTFSRITNVEPSTMSTINGLDTWHKMFMSEKQEFTSEELRGLLGEFWFLNSFLASSLGKFSSVECWNGPIGGSQDFQLPSRHCIEVKNIGVTSDEVKISSEFQLNCESPLHLLVIESKGNDRNALIEKLQIEYREFCKDANENEIALLNSRLARFSSIFEELTNSGERFDPDQMFCYYVTPEFPKIVQTQLTDGIQNVKYSIKLNAIENFRCELVSGIDDFSISHVEA